MRMFTKRQVEGGDGDGDSVDEGTDSGNPEGYIDPLIDAEMKRIQADWDARGISVEDVSVMTAEELEQVGLGDFDEDMEPIV